MPDKIEECFFIEHSLDERFQLAYKRRGLNFSVRTFPCHEPVELGGDGSCLSLESVGNDRKPVAGKQGWDSLFVGFNLIVRGMDGRVFVGRVFQFYDNQGQAVDEENDIRAFIHLVFNHGKLIDHGKIVFPGVVKINQTDKVAAALSVFAINYLDSFGEHPMEGFIIGDKLRGTEAPNLFDSILPRVCGYCGIDAGDRNFKIIKKEHIIEGLT